MSHPILPYAHAAFCSGFAARGGTTVTDRVRAGHRAAIQLAVEHWEDPDIIEATLKLGELEGVWATIYARRQDLLDSTRADFDAAWKTAFSNGTKDFATLVATARHQAGVMEKVDTSSVVWTTSIILAMLHSIMHGDDWQRLRLEVGNSIASGQAYGAADAMELLADKIGALNFNFDKAYTTARQRFENDPGVLRQVDIWLNTLASDVAKVMAKKLHSMAQDGASEEDMQTWAEDELSNGDSPVFGLLFDGLMLASITYGIMWFYRSNGVSQVYFITAGDAAVCQECENAENRNPYPADSAPSPPLHFQCVIGSTRVVVPTDVEARLTLDTHTNGAISDPRPATASAVTVSERDFGRRAIRAATVRDFVGDVVTIKTASGKELTATPNHPIATRGGWVAISGLKVGNYVISSTDVEWEMDSIDPDENNIPPCIEDVAKSFPVTLNPVPTAAEDFHGDGSGSDVHVVFTDGLLLDYRDIERNEIIRKFLLGGRNAEEYGFPDPSPFNEFFFGALDSANGVMGSGGEFKSFLGAGISHPHVHRVTAVPNRNALLDETFPDDTPADVEGFCEDLLAFSSNVALDKVIDVKRNVVSTQVYNLSTDPGWYIGNGIITHNCRCSLVAYEDISGTAISDYLD